MSPDSTELAELFARQQQIRDAAIEELADLLEEAEDPIEFLETKIENGELK